MKLINAITGEYEFNWWERLLAFCLVMVVVIGRDVRYAATAKGWR